MDDVEYRNNNYLERVALLKPFYYEVVLYCLEMFMVLSLTIPLGLRVVFLIAKI